MTRSSSLALFGCLTAALAVSLAPREAAAQFRIGPHVGYNVDVEEAFIGADAWIGIYAISDTIEIHLNPAFHWYFVPDGVTLWGIDLNVPFLFKLPTEAVRVYAGAGLGIFHAAIDALDASDTDFAFNLIGGALFIPDKIVNPYVGLRAYLAEDSGLELAAGVMFRF